MKTIYFVKDFATKKKGEKWECDNMLASQLVRLRKVASYNPPKKSKSKAKK
jgi:hypothetical protein